MTMQRRSTPVMSSRVLACALAAVPTGVVIAAEQSVPEGEPPVAEAAAEAGGPAGRGPVGGILGLGVRAMFDALAPGQRRPLQPIPADEAEDGEMPKDPAGIQAWQQRKQVRQQARHMEQIFQPLLHTELEMIRQTCPGLPPEARREILAIGRAAVTKTALEFATQQLLGGQPRIAADARQAIRVPLAKAVEPHASAAEFAAYGREQQARLRRRARAARVAIVAKLDRHLDLSAAQRRAIEDDLELRWEDSWVRELDDTGMVINGERTAPDYAKRCIEPHLDEQQLADWQRWHRAAGTAVVGMNVGWNLDGQGLHEPDRWWTGEGP